MHPNSIMLPLKPHLSLPEERQDARSHSDSLPTLLFGLAAAVTAWGLLALNEETHFFVLKYQIQPAIGYLRDHGITLLNGAAALASALVVSLMRVDRRANEEAHRRV